MTTQRALAAFQDFTRDWFLSRFGSPTEAQARAWPAIASGRNVLVAAPTGSGKTLAAFLHALDELHAEGLRGALQEATYVVYVSPLKALSHDVEKNLREPLAGLRAAMQDAGLPEVEVRAHVRTGDTPDSERAAMRRHPPHVLVTTPESLYLLLTSDSGRDMLGSVRTVIVDEIHAVARDKRGSHLSLSLERLAALAGPRLTRIGLSATQRPLDEIARFLVGAGNVAADGTPACEIVDIGHARAMELSLEMPQAPLGAVLGNDAREELHDRLGALASAHRTTLVFVNTRRAAERTGRALAERLGEEAVTTHHGSLSREHRLDAEHRLKTGSLRALVATSSLELGIDIGDVDLVCQIGPTRAIAALLQRVGRSGHAVGAVSKGILFPTTRDELLDCLALMSSVRRHELDAVKVPERALDILAQQVVAECACRDWSDGELFALVTRAWPYRNLTREAFDAVVRMLAEGFSTRRGRRAAHVHHDEINGRIRGRKGARLLALTSGGAIPDLGEYDVILEPGELRVGSVHEDFAIESLAGDIFQLGNTSWRVLRVEAGKVRVADAHGQPPTIPFWIAEAAGRTDELSYSLSRLRRDLAARLPAGVPAARHEAEQWLAEQTGAGEEACRQAVTYVAAMAVAAGVVPTQETILLERFFDETGNTHVVLHAPFGSRINRAWGLALRKRFCRQFNFELQAAATEDALVLSLGPTHSFPLDEVFGYLRAGTVRPVLEQAVLAAPVFGTRWRWNATRALALPRTRAGRRVPVAIARMQSEDLLSVVFPDQLACAENLQGDREIPGHPLVEQTMRDCLEEAMDLPGLQALLASMERGERQLVARELTEPSPFAAEILGARPYAFLDDAPLEERRTQAVVSRRWMDPEAVGDLAALDPEAIARVCADAWPAVASPDELHDALVVHGFLTEEEGLRHGLAPFLESLSSERRAATARTDGGALWLAAERLPELRAVLPSLQPAPALQPPSRLAAWAPEAGRALTELLRGRLEALGPVTAAALRAPLGVPEEDVAAALAALEGEGFAMRGRFTRTACLPGGMDEWCDRRLLARIHRATIHRLRAEIEPVATTDFLRFLLGWQRIDADEHAKGPEGLAAVLAQLEGFEAPARAWEQDILAARVDRYRPDWLDALCAAGRVSWVRRAPAASSARGPVRTTPIALLRRERVPDWIADRAASPAGEPDAPASADAAEVASALERRGALFFDEIASATGLLDSRARAAIAELVAAGRVTCDSFKGLRGLILPEASRRPAHRRLDAGALVADVTGAGRWSLVRRGVGNAIASQLDTAHLDRVVRTLLSRWGVVFRRLLDREDDAPPWRDLLRVLWRLEARGEVRGGRFVAGIAGEQFALPEAVTALRAARREPRHGTLVSLSAADPLNLLGLVTPGRRLPSLAGNRLLLRDGEPMAILEAGQASFLSPIPEAEQWDLEKILRRRVPRVEQVATPSA